jgi:hypothetical protein
MLVNKHPFVSNIVAAVLEIPIYKQKMKLQWIQLLESSLVRVAEAVEVGWRGWSKEGAAMVARVCRPYVEGRDDAGERVQVPRSGLEFAKLCRNDGLEKEFVINLIRAWKEIAKRCFQPHPAMRVAHGSILTKFSRFSGFGVKYGMWNKCALCKNHADTGCDLVTLCLDSTILRILNEYAAKLATVRKESEASAMEWLMSHIYDVERSRLIVEEDQIALLAECAYHLWRRYQKGYRQLPRGKGGRPIQEQWSYAADEEASSKSDDGSSSDNTSSGTS